MINIFPRNSLAIHRTVNGFIVNVKGTTEQQEDGLDGVHVFEDIEKLNKFIKTHYKESNKRVEVDVGICSKWNGCQLKVSPGECLPNCVDRTTEVDVKSCKFRKIDPCSPFQTSDVRYFCIGR